MCMLVDEDAIPQTLSLQVLSAMVGLHIPKQQVC